MCLFFVWSFAVVSEVMAKIGKSVAGLFFFIIYYQYDVPVRVAGIVERRIDHDAIIADATAAF
ncbi:hypothetical protein [Edwardsiella tarda]|uniref:hypothetical protein n=1 Tax=Edwardsiella tarda TaxID=636 RepID=UPI003F65A65C